MLSETCQVCSTQTGRGAHLGLLLYPQPPAPSRGRNLQYIRGCAPYSADAIWSTIAIMATPRQNETATIHVLILDDGLVQRDGIARVVEDAKAMTVAGMAATGQEALVILRERPVDLALVDLVLGDRRSGVEVGREMRRMRPELNVIIYTKQKGMVLAAEILWERKTGGQPKLQGYVLTEHIFSSRHLEAIYDTILRTGYYVDPEVLEWHYRLSEFEPLTPREEECALLVADGRSNREIADRMVLSRRRVENLDSGLP